MSLNNVESLSALLDNEADELELQRVIRALESDPELAATWMRMNLAQAVLHDDNLSHGDLQLTDSHALPDRVAKLIAAESAPSRPSFQLQRWIQPLTKLGIAASVAMAFLVGMQTDFLSPEIQTAPLAQQTVNTLEPAPVSQLAALDESLDSQLVMPAREVDPVAAQRLEEYIRSVSITREQPAQLEQLQDSPLYRLVNEIQDK